MKVYFKNIKHQNIFPPILSATLKAKGKSSKNKLRPEACPAIFDASKKGITFFSEKEYSFFQDGNHTVYRYQTKDRKTGELGANIVTPALLGSNENESGYYKIGNGLIIRLEKVGALILPPVDPRFVIRDLDYSIAYLPPGYCGQLVAAVRPKDEVVIPQGCPIGQLVPLSEDVIELIEDNNIVSIMHYEDNYEIISSQPLKTTVFEFYN